MKQNFTVRQGALDGVEAFLSVARHRSFRRAAAELGLTPSAISQAIRALETRVGTVLFIGVFFVVGLHVQRAVVSRRGIELVRDAGAPTLIRWRDLRRVAEATRWEVFRRVWLWPGLPPRGSIMGMSALHHFRIEWQGGCYYFAPADPAAFRQAVAFFRSQVASEMVATAAETDSASRVETPTQPSRGPIGTALPLDASGQRVTFRDTHAK